MNAPQSNSSSQRVKTFAGAVFITGKIKEISVDSNVGLSDFATVGKLIHFSYLLGLLKSLVDMAFQGRNLSCIFLGFINFDKWMEDSV